MENIEEPTKAVEVEEAQESAPVDPRRVKDQERIARWVEARDAMPTADDIARLAREERDAEEMLNTARAARESAVVRQAAVRGWVTVAEEHGITPKRLHGWRREHLPNIEDLSDVPEVVIPREERRVEAERAQAEDWKRRMERIQHHAARLNAIRGEGE